MYYKPPRYTEVDSVGNDFLALQDALVSCEPDINPKDYSCIFGQWLIEYDEQGLVFITELGPERNYDTYKRDTRDAEMNDEVDEYWDDRTAVLDCSHIDDETELFHFFRTEIKPLIVR